MLQTVKLPKTGRQRVASRIQRLAQVAGGNLLDGRTDPVILNRLEKAFKAFDCYAPGKVRPMISRDTMALVGAAF